MLPIHKIATFCLAVGRQCGDPCNCHSLLTLLLGQAMPLFLSTLSTYSSWTILLVAWVFKNKILITQPMCRESSLSFLRVLLKGGRSGWGQGIWSNISHCFVSILEKHETQLNFLLGYLASSVKSTMELH